MANDLHPLLNYQFQVAIEQIVSEHRGKRWKTREFRDMNEFSSHPSALLSDGSYSIFVKFSKDANGLEQFESEMAGLRLLSELSGILIPTLIGNLPMGGGVIMILEGVQAIDRTSQQWRQIGRTLAQIHRNKGRQFGLDSHNYFGPLYQDNGSLPDWPMFYAERRLWPRFIGAINSGNMPMDVIRQVEKLILRIPKLCDRLAVPTLLHGDAHQNNFISTEMGAVVIDPAVYYGHPEMDLAYVDYFQPVPDDVFNGYQEESSIDPGFSERRELWRVYGYLAVVEVEGAAHLPKLINAIRKYL
ncbi:MAG TPA: fructosamine kinase family protein [Anaerolineales bacterium]|nr:fructosamine kinase family protein [Anaerolineales bacterium]